MPSVTMKRLSASIPDKLYSQLEQLADIEGRSISNLVAYLLERSVDSRLELDRLVVGDRAPKGFGVGD